MRRTLTRKSPRTSSFALAFSLVLGLASATAFASEASEAHKQAMALKADVKKAGSDAAKKAEAEAAVREFAKGKAALLVGQKATLSKMDLCYLGLLQGLAGETQDGITTLRESVAKQEETKYGANIHLNLVQALIDADQPDGAASEVEKMQTLYDGSKELKVALMNLGMAYRGALNFPKSADWLRKAFAAGNTNATKPLVNSLLMANKKDEALAAVQAAIDGGIPQQKEDMQTYKAAIEKVDTDVSAMLSFDAFVPSGSPETKDKVVVMGFWNVSSKTFKWTLRLLDKIKTTYKEDVTCIAATTYYKKNADTGKIEESLSPEAERGFGQQLAEQESWRGWMGYLKDEAAVASWGVVALPHFVVVGKDGKLLFTHTMDPSGGGETDVKILTKLLDDLIGK